MKELRTLGLLYAYNENWIGGTYYIQNLVNAFNALDDNKKPEIFIYTDSAKDFQGLEKATTYPRLRHASIPAFSFFERAVNKISKLSTGKRLLKWKVSYTDMLFPTIDDQFLPDRQERMFWIPDLQEHFLPQFCTKEEIEVRTNWQKALIKRNVKVVFSSRSTQTDYRKIYPGSATMDFIVPFAVTHPEYDSLDFDKLKKKYAIRRSYFFAPNQFWAHKNHRVILDAVKLIKARGEDICVLFTGKPNDYRNPGYFESLTKYVQDNGLQDNVFFLGFIERAEQLKLMQQAIAVIQPSRFEGWSTVIEDAKAMNQFVIASDLDVNKEQIQDNVHFFGLDDPDELATILVATMKNRPVIVERDYQVNVKRFATDFLAAAVG